jgi:hypothetical protein
MGLIYLYLYLFYVHSLVDELKWKSRKIPNHYFVSKNRIWYCPFGRICTQLGQQGTKHITELPQPKAFPTNDDTALSAYSTNRSDPKTFLLRTDFGLTQTRTWKHTVNISQYPSHHLQANDPNHNEYIKWEHDIPIIKPTICTNVLF